MGDLGVEPSMPEASDLQSGAVTSAARHPLTLIVLSALFAMLNGIGGHPTVYVHSYSGLTFPPWLTNNTIKVSSHFFPKALD